jgi:hypothetical protein
MVINIGNNEVIILILQNLNSFNSKTLIAQNLRICLIESTRNLDWFKTYLTFGVISETSGLFGKFF